jgi:hypothetical protein
MWFFKTCKREQRIKPQVIVTTRQRWATCSFFAHRAKKKERTEKKSAKKKERKEIKSAKKKRAQRKKT